MVDPALFLYDLSRLRALRAAEESLRDAEAALRIVRPWSVAPRTIGIVAGSYNPLTRGHEALVRAATADGCDGILLLLPLSAIDKESVVRASVLDRALVLLEWARDQENVAVGLTNAGLFVEYASLLQALYPESQLLFIVGHDKIIQILDRCYYVDREEALGRLFSLASFRVAPRAGHGPEALGSLLAAEENRRYLSSVHPLALDRTYESVSSTEVRERVRRRGAWEGLVPSPVATFIRETRAYDPAFITSRGEKVDPYDARQTLLSLFLKDRSAQDNLLFKRLYDEAREQEPREKP